MQLRANGISSLGGGGGVDRQEPGYPGFCPNAGTGAALSAPWHEYGPTVRGSIRVSTNLVRSAIATAPGSSTAPLRASG